MGIYDLRAFLFRLSLEVLELLYKKIIFHCHNNLQVITAVENYSKGNKLIGKYTKLSPIL